MEKIGKIITSLLILPWVAWADIAVVATVDETEVSVGDSIGLTISVRSSDNVDIDEPAVPPINGFELQMLGSSTSFSTRMVPGQGGMQFQSQRQKEFRYQLIAEKEGQWQIPSIQVVVDSKSYSTDPVTIQVLAPGSTAQKNLPPDINEEMDEAEQLFNQLLQRRGSGGGGGNAFVPKNQKESFLVHVDVDKTEMYEGEQITANWYIYTRGNILSLERVKFPDLKGFWKEIIEEVPSLNFTQEVINGVPYRKALLASHALFPIKAGTVYIDEYKVKANVQVPSGIGLFGFGQSYSFNRSSEKVKIQVNPLPTQGRPSDFSGAVGKFSVRSMTEAKDFPINQPFLWKIRFDGSGNAKLIELPAIEIPPGIEKYDTKSDSKFFKDGQSFKEFQLVMIPRQMGELTLPSVSVSMFNPQTHQYYLQKTEPITIHITNSGTQGIEASRVKGKKVTLSLPLPVTEWKSHLLWTAHRYSVIGTIYLLVIITLLLKAKSALGWGKRKKDLMDHLNQKLKVAQKLMSEKNWRQVGTELTNVVYFVLGEVSSQGGANVTLEKLLPLCPPSIQRELGEDLQKVIDQLQVLSFAPEEVVGKYKEKEQLQKLYLRVKELMTRSISLAKGQVSE